MIKVGSLDISTPSSDAFAILTGKDTTTLTMPYNHVLSSEDVSRLSWLEPFNWVFNTSNYGALVGLILFHLYSHKSHCITYDDNFGLKFTKGFADACRVVKLRLQYQGMAAPPDVFEWPNNTNYHGTSQLQSLLNYNNPCFLDVARHDFMSTMQHETHGGIQVIKIGYLHGVQWSTLELWRSNVDDAVVFVLESRGEKPIFAFATTNQQEFHRFHSYTLSPLFASIVPQWFPHYVQKLEAIFRQACTLMPGYRPFVSSVAPEVHTFSTANGFHTHPHQPYVPTMEVASTAQANVDLTRDHRPLRHSLASFESFKGRLMKDGTAAQLQETVLQTEPVDSAVSADSLPFAMSQAEASGRSCSTRCSDHQLSSHDQRERSQSFHSTNAWLHDILERAAIQPYVCFVCQLARTTLPWTPNSNCSPGGRDEAVSRRGESQVRSP